MSFPPIQLNISKKHLDEKHFTLNGDKGDDDDDSGTDSMRNDEVFDDDENKSEED